MLHVDRADQLLERRHRGVKMDRRHWSGNIAVLPSIEKLGRLSSSRRDRESMALLSQDRRVKVGDRLSSRDQRLNQVDELVKAVATLGAYRDRCTSIYCRLG